MSNVPVIHLPVILLTAISCLHAVRVGADDHSARGDDPRYTASTGGEERSQKLQRAAQDAADGCLALEACFQGPLHDAPLPGFEPMEGKDMRLLVQLAQIALDAHEAEWRRLARDRTAMVEDGLDALRLDRSGHGEIRLSALGPFSEIAVHLRGRIESPDGAHPAAVVHYARRVSGDARPTLGRVILPVTAWTAPADGAPIGPTLSWRGAVVERFTGDGWKRRRTDDAAANAAPGKDARRRRASEFCDATCSGFGARPRATRWPHPGPDAASGGRPPG